MSAKVILTFCTPADCEAGDYAILYGNGGDGEIDWVNPLLNGRKFDLFPMGGGIYGWGHAPWGHFPWGHALSMRTLGWGHLPWGHFPWGHGTALISTEVPIVVCGDYKFAFVAFDSLGNANVGDPQEISLTIHTAPPMPTGLTKYSYNKDTDVLILNAV